MNKFIKHTHTHTPTIKVLSQICCSAVVELEPSQFIAGDYLFFLKMPFQDHVKEKLKLVQKFLHVDAQDQLTSLEEMMKSSEISMVCDIITY